MGAAAEVNRLVDMSPSVSSRQQHPQGIGIPRVEPPAPHDPPVFWYVEASTTIGTGAIPTLRPSRRPARQGRCPRTGCRAAACDVPARSAGQRLRRARSVLRNRGDSHLSGGARHTLNQEIRAGAGGAVDLRPRNTPPGGASGRRSQTLVPFVPLAGWPPHGPLGHNRHAVGGHDLQGQGSVATQVSSWLTQIVRRPPGSTT